MKKSYTELNKLKTFEERFEYLKMDGIVGVDTFGANRYLNQILYTSLEWRTFRNEIIIRDEGCDLAVKGYEINNNIIVHHINPLTVEDILNRSSKIFDRNNVICVSLDTHNRLHYGNDKIPFRGVIVERTPYDTCPWKRRNKKC